MSSTWQTLKVTDFGFLHIPLTSELTKMTLLIILIRCNVELYKNYSTNTSLKKSLKQESNTEKTDNGIYYQ